jgi:TRAP-type C4-dicarboxylate transport system substrate-binding protein
VNFQVVSAAWFGELPADYQTALVEECRTAGRETSEVIQEATEKAKAEVQEHGMKIVEDVDMAAFRKAGDKAYEVLGLIEAKNQVHKEIGK